MSNDKYTIGSSYGGGYCGDFAGGYQQKPANSTTPDATPEPPATTPAAKPGIGDMLVGANATPQPVKDISTAEFMTEVIEASKTQPVLVDFWATWCGPCKQLAPVLEKVVGEAAGRVKLVKMDIDKHPEVAGQMGIQSIPAVVAFVDGKPADAFMGAKPEGEIKNFIEKLVGPGGPSELELALEEAENLKKEGDTQGAASLYMSILQADPENAVAKAGLGQLYLEADNMEAARSVAESLSDEDLKVPQVTAFKTALDLAEQADDLGETQDLLDKVEANPKDHQARIDLAIALNAHNKREEAADHLLESIRVDRAWNDEAAKKQLLQFFEAWGMTDEATVTARRQLSSILFS